jgi:hypothetical protein
MRASALCVRRGVIVFGSGSIVGKGGGALQTRETIQSKNEQSNHAGIVSSTMGAPALCIRRGLIVVRSGSIVRKR